MRHKFYRSRSEGKKHALRDRPSTRLFKSKRSPRTAAFCSTPWKMCGGMATATDIYAAYTTCGTVGLQKNGAASMAIAVHSERARTGWKGFGIRISPPRSSQHWET